jgi:hypothetical protein
MLHFSMYYLIQDKSHHSTTQDKYQRKIYQIKMTDCN